MEVRSVFRKEFLLKGDSLFMVEVIFFTSNIIGTSRLFFSFIPGWI